MGNWMPKEDQEKLKKLKLIDKAYGSALSNIKSFIDENQQGNCETYLALPDLKKKEDIKIYLLRKLNGKGDSVMQLSYLYLDGVIDANTLNKHFTRKTQNCIRDLIELWARCKLHVKPVDLDKLGKQ